MEVNEQNQVAMVAYLEQTLQPATREQAEAFLRSVEAQRGFPRLLATMIGNLAIPLPTRQAGAIYLKNFIKRRWAQVPGEPDQIDPIDREAIRAAIIDLMVAVEPLIQRQVAESVSLIASHDFPTRWPTLIPTLVARLSPTEFSINNSILQALHYILRPWRSKFRSDDLFAEINLVLTDLTTPYRDLLRRTDQLIQENSTNSAALDIYMRSLELLAKLFITLNIQDIPEFFEDNLPEFMSIWHRYLVYTNSLLEAEADEDLPGPMERVRSEICDIVSLYTQRYEDLFTSLPSFIESIWKILSDTGKETRFDHLVGKGMAFLTSVLKSANHASLFASPDLQRQLCEKIVLPNLEIRPSDEELLEDEPLLYVRRDLEGSDSGTRRRAASDLIRGLMLPFKASITEIAASYVSHFLRAYRTDPFANWRLKDTALALMTAVASEGVAGSAHGVSSTSDLFDVVSFYDANVLEDLTSPMPSIPTLLQIDAIRYLLAYRRQLGRDRLLPALSLLIDHLRSPDLAVRTFSAYAIERLLAEPTARVSPEDLGPLAGDLLSRLLAILLPSGPSGALPPPERISEHDYPMRAIMRTVYLLKAHISPHIESLLLPSLTTLITAIAPNPANPRFTHALFESLCGLIRFVCASSPDLIAPFEAHIFPLAEDVLRRDLSEIIPYLLQILAQTLQIRSVSLASASLPPTYRSLFPFILQPALWDSAGNIPALSALLQTYLRADPASIVANAQLEAILGIFQKLLASAANNSHGFDLLEALILSVDAAALAKYWPAVFHLLLKRLQITKDDRYTRAFLYFLHFTVLVRTPPGYGPDFALDILESIQPGLALQIFKGVMIPEMKNLQVESDVRVCVAGLVTILCESPRLRSSPFIELWGPAFDVVSTLSQRPWGNTNSKITEDDEVYLADLEEGGYQASSAKLSVIAKGKVVPPVDVSDLPRFIAPLLVAFNTAIGGNLESILAPHKEALLFAKACTSS